MSALPEAFTGAWMRNGISLDGGPFHEDAVVWWLQAPEMHADLRVPHDAAGPSTCFAGVTTWDGTALTWQRGVDLEHYDGVDSGIATWDGDDLLETGVFANPDGTTTAYVERWVRLPDSTGPLYAEERGGLHAVRAGAYALTISDDRPAGGPFRGTAWTWSGDRWMVHHTLAGAPLAIQPSDVWALR
jgi:hypothetical protein